MSKLIKDITSILLNQSVQVVRLVGNSLILYLNCHPGEKKGFSLWLEPVWNFKSDIEVITGSRQAQTEDEEEHKIVMDKLNRIINKKITEINIEAISNDLIIRFEDRYFISTFVSDPNDEESWIIRDLKTGIRLIGNPKSIKEI